MCHKNNGALMGDDIGERLDRSLEYENLNKNLKGSEVLEISLSDLKPCLNWDDKNKLCNIIYAARISPKYGQWDLSNFYKECKGSAIPSLCAAFQTHLENKFDIKKVSKIPNIRLFEV